MALCDACGAPQPLPQAIDHFALLDLTGSLVVDPAELERRYHALSRAAHPDRHQGADPRAQQLSVLLSAEVNRAYRTLRDPVARGRYWLALHGRPLGVDNNQIPPSLAALVFETQEDLEALRDDPGPASRARVRGIRDDVAARISGLVEALKARYASWSPHQAASDGVLQELRLRLTELSYLGTLLEDIDVALEET